MEQRYLKVNAADNVAVIISSALKGDTITLDGKTITITDDVPSAHKIAVCPIREGQPIIKYGHEIGRASRDIAVGEWVHTHNLTCTRGKVTREEAGTVKLKQGNWTGPYSGRKMSFMGYKRPYGGVGTRNHLLILSNVFCSGCAAEQVSRALPGSVLIRHNLGCGQIGFDLELSARTLKAMAKHPNVGAVIIIGLGCERLKAREIYDDVVSSTGKDARLFIIQDEGGIDNTVKKAIAEGRKMMQFLALQERTVCDVSELFITTKCGGTDSNSGLAANPVLGYASDCVVSLGGSSIISELNELIGTEDYLASRAVNDDVKNRIYTSMHSIEDFLKGCIDPRLPDFRNQLISPGNFDGGVSSIVEKALGGVHKCGSAPITDVLDYALPPKDNQKGLFMMSYESVDGEVTTGMIGCGSQLVCFTTGRGNPTGHPIAPVIKITGNHEVYERMKDDFDFDASALIRGEKTLEELGEELFSLILEVAGGKLTSAEKHCGNELFCMPRRHGCSMTEKDDIQHNYC
ncbi:MAG: UxaA family hydrolase [Bullifex sp.]